MKWLALLPAALAALVLARGGDELAVATLGIPALLWWPGRGIAARLTTDPLARIVLAFWISVTGMVAAVLIAAWTGLGGPGVLAFAVTLTAFGERLSPLPAARVARGPSIGAFAVVLAVGFAAWDHRTQLTTPMDGWWWSPDVESTWERPAALPQAGAGWTTRTKFGAHAWKLEPRVGDPFLLGPGNGGAILVLRGPVGATMQVRDRTVAVQASPVEDREEGPVRRYRDRGTVAVAVKITLDAGERLAIRLSQPLASTVYLLGSEAGIWELHGAGELRFAHYYQLLNMVEQVDWATELYADRRVTDVQPPLPSYVLAAPLGLTNGDLPTVNVLFLFELLFVGLAGVLTIRAWAPDAPSIAFTLPAVATLEHARMLLEPGSAGQPDTLYTLAILGAVASLAHGRGYATAGLLAQLCRYPGTLVVVIAGLLAGRPRLALGMLGLVLGVAAMFGLGGALSGSLPGWLATVAWETGPEHWHGEADPAVLFARIPRFYALWLGYAGGLPLLAAVRWPAGTRVALGTALIYSLLLCTIDHSPTHYFVPLVQLSAIAAGTTAAALRGPLRTVLPVVGTLGGLAAYGYMELYG